MTHLAAPGKYIYIYIAFVHERSHVPQVSLQDHANDAKHKVVAQSHGTPAPHSSAAGGTVLAVLAVTLAPSLVQVTKVPE